MQIFWSVAMVVIGDVFAFVFREIVLVYISMACMVGLLYRVIDCLLIKKDIKLFKTDTGVNCIMILLASMWATFYMLSQVNYLQIFVEYAKTHLLK